MSTSSDRFKVIAKATAPDPSVQMAIVMSIPGIWDLMSIRDRESWVQRGEILNTPAGNKFFNLLDSIGGFND